MSGCFCGHRQMRPSLLRDMVEDVTFQSGIVSGFHPNNNENVLVLEEFMEVMMRVAIKQAGRDETMEGKPPVEQVQLWWRDVFSGRPGTCRAMRR